MQIGHEPMGQYVEHFSAAIVDTNLVVIGLVDGQRITVTFDADEQAALLALLGTP